jgi:ABC-type glycerol-3-phosphate transport system substrate-binding protein
MESMTRRRYLAGTAAAMGGAISACGTFGGGGAPKDTMVKAPVTVEYWTFWTQERLDFLLPHLPTFEQRSRYIKANITGSADFRTKLRTAVVAGNPPEATIGDIFSYALYADQGSLLDLGPFVKRDRIDLARDYVIDGFEYWCGKLHAFPLDGFTYALTYNKTMFRERGIPDPWDVHKGQWTWDDFSDALTKLSREGVIGFVPDGHGLERGYHPFLLANGGGYFDYDNMRYMLDHPKTIEAMEWLHDMATRRLVMTTPDQTAELNRATNSLPFVARKVGIIGEPGNHVRPSTMQAIGDSFEWDIVPYPRRNRNSPSWSFAGCNAGLVFAKSPHPEEGYELLRFFGGEEVQGGLGAARIVPPALKKARNDPNGYLKAPPKHMHVFNDIWDGGYHRTTRTYHYRDLQTQPMLNQLITSAFRGERGIKEAMQEASRVGNAEVEFGKRCFQPRWKKS